MNLRNLDAKDIRRIKLNAQLKARQSAVRLREGRNIIRK